MQKRKRKTTNFKVLREEELHIIIGGSDKKKGNFISTIFDAANRTFNFLVR